MNRIVGRATAPVVFVLFATVGYMFGGKQIDVPTADPRPAGGDERQMIYIGSSGCQFANRPEMVDILARIRKSVSASADASSRRFVMVGIAKDSDIKAGLAHLDKFGAFDEVITGRNWLNLGGLKYVYGDMPGAAGTPQVLVVDRTLQVDANGVAVTAETLVKRRAGLIELRDWAAEGGTTAAPRSTGVTLLSLVRFVR
jgi:hypothetical protein